MTILITGGAGYIGSHTAKCIASKGFQPLVLDSLVHGHREFVKWGTFIEGDLSDKYLLQRIFKEHQISAVLHFAGHAYVGESVTDPAKYYRNNVVNTLNLLENMQEANVNRFIFSSSCATYGVPKSIPITEDHQQIPSNPYGFTKLAVENLLRDFNIAHGLKYVSLRYFNAAGADPNAEIGEWHDPETHLIPLALDVAMGKRKTLDIFGADYDTPDGTCIRDYIHVSDLADAHLLALEHLKAGGASKSLNLGNSIGFSVRDIIKTVEQITGNIIRTIEKPRRQGDPPILIGSFDKAYQTLGWKPRFTDLSYIIETAWNWAKRGYSK